MLRQLCVLATTLCVATAQSNYASHGNSIEYPHADSEGALPDSATLDGKVTKLDDLQPVIFLNRTKAALNCGAGSMQIELKFNEPFYGIAYADFDRNSACQTAGRGATSAKLEFPLKGCGTKQDPQRVFTNNVVVRFHPGLEMDGDEVITIVCRYPPPVAPIPAGLPIPIVDTAVPVPVLEPPLKGFHILLIICAILFLSLLLLGLGCSYVCLKKRNITVVRRHPFTTSGSGSEITKLSGSSLGNISMFEGLKIPRAHAAATPSSSGSEAALIMAGSSGEHSDNLPSDYPSESPSSAHSEVEDVETYRRPSTVSSAGSYENKAFQHQEQSMYAEYGQQMMTTAAVAPPPPEPKFDVSVRVKRAAPLPPPSPTPSSTTTDVESQMSTQARNLTTILERGATSFSYVPELHSPPPPVYSSVLRRQEASVIIDNDNWSQAEEMVDAPQRRMSMASARSLNSLNTEMTDTRSVTEMVDHSHSRYAATIAPPPPPPPPVVPVTLITTADLPETPLVVTRRPEVTSHVVDDVFLRTITEKRTIEDVERHRRQITEYHARPQPPPTWDVQIRNYPAPDAPMAPDCWDSCSETSSMSGAPPPERQYSRLEIERSYLSTLEVPAPNPPLPNWDVLIRVVNPPLPEDAPAPGSTDFFREEAVLTLEDRQKWRQIITTESTLRTLLTEATMREDFERIRSDHRYEQLFEPPKWDVIIRILAPPDRPTYDQRGGAASNSRYRRKQEWDTRSRRSSLPTLYEYDSDGGSSVRTLTADVVPPPARSRRTSRSSLRSDMDVRSMTEMTVDFARADALSDASSYYRRSYDEEDDAGSLVRSLSQPSLARSASEFTEQWVPRWEGESSPEGSPRSGRSRTSGLAFQSAVVRETRHSFTQQGWYEREDHE